MYGESREREEFPAGNNPSAQQQQQQQQQQQINGGNPMASTAALGLEALHSLCREVYPEQLNPLTVTAVVKFWLGGPDPLDYISMYENPGNPELGVPPHWHYVSFGLSDLHGDSRLHPRTGPGHLSGFGFELTFRLLRERGEKTPPTWPANVMQQLAKYVFTSNNMLMPGDFVSWHSPLDNSNNGGPGGNRPSRINQILMGQDPQFPEIAHTPHGDVSFVQIVGVTSEELQAAQHWNGLGVVNLLKAARGCGPWLLTDMRRTQSIMEEDPSVAEKVQSGIAREGSNLSGVSAKCWWVQMGDKSTQKYREQRQESDEEDDGDIEPEEEIDIKPNIKSERLSPCEQDVKMSVEQDSNGLKTLMGLHLTFNLEAGTLLPLAIKGRVMHGRHFTFKSILSHAAVTLVPPSVTGTFATKEKPYAVQDPWLQVLLPDELTERMAQEFQVLNAPEQLQLPKTFTWPEYKLAITIVND